MLQHNPKLTVLMPVFNAAEYLSATIESILNQTFKSFQLLIIDDGSTDLSSEILEHYASRDKRVRIVRQDNSGIVRTLNRGISLSETDLIARHDADDLSLPTRFEKQVAFMQQNPDCAAVGSGIEVFGEGRSPSSVFHYEHHVQITDCFLLENCLAHGSVMFRKGAVLEHGGYSELPHARHIEDYDLWIRVARAHRVANIGEILYQYRVHPNSISSRQSLLQKQNTRALAKRIRTERWYKDFWRVTKFSPDHWSSIPGAKKSCTTEADRALVYFQARTIAALLFLREWRAASIRLSVAFRRSPLQLPTQMLVWVLRTGFSLISRRLHPMKSGSSNCVTVPKTKK